MRNRVRALIAAAAALLSAGVWLSAVSGEPAGAAPAAAPGDAPARLAAAPGRPEAGYVPITPQAQRCIEKGLQYLALTQQEDGAWGGESWPKNTGITGFALLAFLAGGDAPGEGQYGAQVQKTVDFLVDQIKPSGLCSTKWTSYGPMYEHALATLALCEAYGMSPREDMRAHLRRAVDIIVRSQHPDGGWRYLPVPSGDSDISVTVCQVMALRAARNAGFAVPKETIDRAVEYVHRCAQADGAFGYQPGYSTGTFPCTAAGITTLYGAGAYQDKQIELGMAHLFRVAPDVGSQTHWADAEHYFYGHYYGIQAAYQAGGKHWEAWYPKIRDALVTHQDRDGGWDEGGYLHKHTGNIGRTYATACALIVLQAPKRYLPIFHR
jgi:hypothetical protein